MNKKIWLPGCGQTGNTEWSFPNEASTQILYQGRPDMGQVIMVQVL
jgi:hypothetical protein